ncbi:MAG: hypothetical protein GX989_00170 [Firmicutes bacterium]|nr:hypothetical protein [Bacillota bacterium]
MMPLIKKKAGVKWEKFIAPVLFLLFIVLIFFHLLLLKNTHPGKTLQNALQNMEKNEELLELEIQEEGSGYEMNFRGSFKDEAIRGRFSGYGLEVYKHSSGSLFVKDLKDDLWKKPAELGLEALEDFFISPLELLSAWSHLFRNARFAHQSEELEKERIIRLPVPTPEAEKTAFLHNFLRDAGTGLECLIFLEPDTLFINRIVLSLQDDRFAGAVTRTLSFTRSVDQGPQKSLHQAEFGL